MENSMAAPPKIKSRTAISSSNFTSEIELKEGAQRDIYTFMFIAALFTVAKDGSKPNIY